MSAEIVTDVPDRLGCLHYIVFSLFLSAAIIINFVNCPWLKPFVLLTFFFVPGYLLLRAAECQLKYTHIELILLSFGLSLCVIILFTYVLTLFNLLSMIILVLTLLTTFLFIMILLRENQKDFSKSNLTKISLKSIWQNILRSLHSPKYVIVVILIAVVFFCIGFSLRQYFVFRWPDEYYYLWSSNGGILPNLQYRVFPYMNIHFILSSTLKLGFLLLLSSFFGVTGSIGIAPHVLTLFFYSMLIPVTYLIGSLHNKKTGIIAALLIGCNPIIWFWNSRIMPDIIYTLLAATSFYFFYKAFNVRGKINLQFLMPFVLFALISYTIQPKMLFVWSIPFLGYLLASAKKRQFLIEIAIISICGILLVGGVSAFAPWFFEYDLKDILGGAFSVFSFGLNDWITFLSPQGATWFSWAYPYYYTHAVLILSAIGFLCFAFKHVKRESFLFLFSIVMCLFLHVTVFANQDARFSFMVFPLLMTLAAIGLTTNLGLYSLLLLPFLYFLFPILPTNEPAVFFSQVADPLRILSRLVAFSIIIYKVLEGVLPNLQALPFKRLQKLGNMQVSKQVTFIMLILILSTSLSIGISTVYDPQYVRSDYVNPDQVGLTQAGIWLVENAPANSVIITNVRSQTLSYYTNCSFDIESADWKIDQQGAGTIITPVSQTEFSELIDASKFDYLIVFSEPVAGEFWRRSYSLPYVDDDALFTIYAPVAEPSNISSCESIDDWTVTRGAITFSIDAYDKKENLYSVKAEGMTQQDTGKTRIFYNSAGTWNLSKVDALKFWFKLDKATKPQYFSVILSDKAGNYRYWLNNTQVFQNWSSGDWQNLEMPLDNYEGQEGQFDIEQVNYIAFYVYAAPDTAITYHLDYIQGYSNLKRIYTFPK